MRRCHRALPILVAITALVALQALPASAHGYTQLKLGVDTARHVRLAVSLKYDANTGNYRAECSAANDGGSHDHSHRITACQLRDYTTGQTFMEGCGTNGGYGPCGYSMQAQHWHTQWIYVYCNAPVNVIEAVGGFDVVGHSHATVYSGRYNVPITC